MPLKTQTISPGIALVVTVAKSLDINSAQAFRDAMKPVVSTHKVVLIDMTSLTFVDSSGLGALLSSLRALKENDGEMRLFGMTGPVTQLFHLVRMHRVFPIFKSYDDALRGLPDGFPTD